MTDRETAALRWAIVGTGAISAQFADDLALVDGADRQAVASRDRVRARGFAEEHKVAHAGGFDEILRMDDVDVIYIATPPATHHHLARRAMMAGKHIVVEKPATLNAAETADLVQVAEVTGAFFAEAMWMKFNPAYRRLIGLLRDGIIGEVRSVRASFGLPFPRGTSSRWNAELGGSALLDQGIYPVTLAHDVLGTPDKVAAAGRSVDGVAVAQHMTFDYSDGRYAQLASAMTEFIEPTASISGTGGWVHIPFPFWAATEFTVHRSHPERFLTTEHISEPREGHGYVPMIREFQAAIAAGEQQHPWHRWHDTTQVHTLLDSIERAIAQAPGTPAPRLPHSSSPELADLTPTLKGHS